jgi:NAD-dependent dihydropyrimidine dehydrogenase PreA subunit
MWEVVVDKDKCNGDEECVDACPSEVFEMVVNLKRLGMGLNNGKLC